MFSILIYYAVIDINVHCQESAMCIVTKLKIKIKILDMFKWKKTHTFVMNWENASIKVELAGNLCITCHSQDGTTWTVSCNQLSRPFKKIKQHSCQQIKQRHVITITCCRIVSMNVCRRVSLFVGNIVSFTIVGPITFDIKK